MKKTKKICRDCKQEKPVEEFTKNGKDYNGNQTYRPNCRPCFATEMRMKYRTNPSHRAYMKELSKKQHIRLQALRSKQ